MCTIEGRVTDKNTKEALIGVCISYSSDTTYKMVLTDIKGYYKITADPGVYKIKFQYIGFKLAEVTNIAVKKDSNTVVDVALEESSETLKSIVVSDSKVDDMENNE